MNTKRLLLTASLAILLGFTGCGEKKNEQSAAPARSKTEAAAPQKKESFLLGNGKETISAKLTEKGYDFNVTEPVVLIDFFATWCPPCRAEIPHLADLQKRYEGKLKVIGVLIETKSTAAMNRFIEGHGINYFVSNAPDNIDFATTTADMLHQPKNFSIPFMILFVKGKYFRHYIGMVPEEMIESDIKEALGEVK
ncbi:TlpA family protein disulfide reductase [Hydrogenimonas sp. SS33]|uniref:TlpA family protein disulfide reductase n=1 Tax=Hydrogenimonas leucolamina TaxID=2954236 RepID=UPI00336C2EBE